MKYINFFLVIFLVICTPKASFAAAKLKANDASYFREECLADPHVRKPKAQRSLFPPQAGFGVTTESLRESTAKVRFSGAFKANTRRKASSDSGTSSESVASSAVYAVSAEDLRTEDLCNLICTKLQNLGDSGLKGDYAIEHVEEILRLLIPEGGVRISRAQKLQILNVADTTGLEECYTEALSILCGIISVDIPDAFLSTDA